MGNGKGFKQWKGRNTSLFIPKKVAQAAVSEMQTTGFHLLTREERNVKKKKGRKRQRQNGGSLAANSACVMPGRLSRAAESVSKH